MLGDHHMWGKNAPFEPASHVPLIIRDPSNREAAGTEIDAFTESIDIAPTILEWVGIEQPLAFNGSSLAPLLAGQIPSDWRDFYFGEIDLGDSIAPTRFERKFGLPSEKCNYAILREETYKYVHFNGGLPPLLFDMKNDPGELNNLATDEQYAPQLARMSAKMLDHRMTHAHQAMSRMQISASKGMMSR